MECKRLSHYQGTKSEKIQQMINETIREQKKAKLPEIKKDRKLVHALAFYRDLRDNTNKAKKKLEAVCDSLGVEFSDYRSEITVLHSCHVPKVDFEQLQLADNLNSLGKTKEAKEVWDKLIAKYKLLE